MSLVVKHLNNRRTPTKDLEEYANVDSDCEGESTEAGDGTLKGAENEETRAVLITGSFSAYVCPLARASR